MMVRQFAAVSAVFALMISLCISQPLLAADAQSANKPKDMLTITSSTVASNICKAAFTTGTYYAYDLQVMDDLSVIPFTIPAGYKFVITYATYQGWFVKGNVARLGFESGLIVDTAVGPDITMCMYNNPGQLIRGHLEKDIP